MSRITHEPGTGSITEQRPHTSLASNVTTQASRAGTRPPWWDWGNARPDGQSQRRNWRRLWLWLWLWLAAGSRGAAIRDEPGARERRPGLSG
jgi:hypothetical protein